MIAGSSTVFTLAERLAIEFVNEGYADQLLIDSIGSGAGFERFCVATETDISTASRLIHSDEIATCQGNGRDPIGFRIGSNVLAVVVSADNDFVEGVTLEELAEIFSTAETWQDVRPDWPAEPILRFAPGTDSGAFDYFVEAVFEQDPAPLLNAANLQLSEVPAVLREGIKLSPFSVGFFDYAYYAEQSENLRVLAINGTTPDATRIETNDYFLSRPLFLYTTATIMQEKPQVAAFLNYALSNATSANERVGYTAPTTARLNEGRRNWLVAMDLLQQDERLYLPKVRAESRLIVE
ncbi:MAG: phosphate-binding protein [Chloroflexaceae bacterium]|nr:phosphate-binding protein [Chloroflexaceae bacterium]